MSQEREIQNAIDALHAVRVARETYASSEKGAEIITAIADALAPIDTPEPPTPAIHREVGKALRRVYLGGK